MLHTAHIECFTYSQSESPRWEKKKNAELILLVTLVYIYNNLFLMKQRPLCGWGDQYCFKGNADMLHQMSPPRGAADAWLTGALEGEKRKEKGNGGGIAPRLRGGLTCCPVTNRMEPSLACTTCRKTWSRMRSSLQQFCSSFIWSSTWSQNNKISSTVRFSYIFLYICSNTRLLEWVNVH